MKERLGATPERFSTRFSKDQWMPVVRNDFKTASTDPSSVALFAYHEAQLADLKDGVGGSDSESGLSSTISPYASFSFVDNSVQGGGGGVFATVMWEQP